MQINITSRHMDLTPAIEEYAEGKAERLTRFFDRVQQIEMIIAKRNTKKQEDFDVEIITTVEKHDPFVARADGGDLYACIDQGIDRASRLLKDHKSRLRDNKHHTPTSGMEIQ